jgi:hypothetical protein
MKKISIPIFAFSVIFYLLFIFVLFDASDAISHAGFLVCFVLSAVNLANSVILLRKNRKQNMPMSELFFSVFVINLIIFLVLAAFVLAVYFLPYHISVG